MVLETTVLQNELFSFMLLYFKEIKNRLALVFLSQISTGLSLYYYKNILLFSTVYPVLVLEKFSAEHFVVTDILELTSIYSELLSFLNVQIMTTVFLYHFLSFLAPAWCKKEFKVMQYFGKVFFCLGLMSGLVTHFIFAPLTWCSCMEFYEDEFQSSFNLHFEPKLIEYLEFYMSLYWTNFRYFQSVGLLFLVINLPFVTSQFVKKYRKLCYFCLTVGTAAVCPDTFSQLIFTVVLFVTYEVSLIKKIKKILVTN